MALQILNPLTDSRWDDLVARHPRASAFHRRGWIEALTRTYGYAPFVLTTAPSGTPLGDGIVLCQTSSWITGRRLISLPFTDHLEPLLSDLDDAAQFWDWLRAECDHHGWKYVELRSLSGILDQAHGLRPSRAYYFHELDLRPDLEQIFRTFHKDSIQRRIKRAKKEELSSEAGCSEKLVNEFYGLVLITRRRHKLLPQPRTWFLNLVECLGDTVQIRVARKGEIPIAGMLTLRHRSSVIYKYGCSDERFHGLGGMPFLFWELVQDSKASGAEQIDLGRSDLDNEGLITFKDRLGATRKLLTYCRYPSSGTVAKATHWSERAVRHLFSLLPDPVFSLGGEILYKHMA